MAKEYCIQPGDNFHALALRWGGTCEDFLLVNPDVDPLKLQIGQKIVLPDFIATAKGQGQYADIRPDQGEEFVGDYLDEVEMEVEGVRVRLRRIGEPRTPHEIHFILPRTEIRKIQPQGGCGPSDVQVMLSNIDVVLSPRLVSGKGDSAEQGKLVSSPEQSKSKALIKKTVQRENASPQLSEAQTQQLPPGQEQPSQFGTPLSNAQGQQTAAEAPQGYAQAQNLPNQPRWRMTFPFS